MRNKACITLVFALALILVSACSPGPKIPEMNEATIAVIAAGTISAQQTKDARFFTPTLRATSTLAPSATLYPTATLAPTQTPRPTNTPGSTSTPTTSGSPAPSATATRLATAIAGGTSGGSGGSGPTSTPTVCNWAAFVSDVTIPDGTVMSPGELFTKVWRVRNIGTCTWSKKYDLVHVDGDRIGASKTIGLPQEVKPGQTVDLAVPMAAPEDRGHYLGEWMLANSDGKRFGIGPGAKGTLEVDIQVKDTGQQYVYDFIANYCAAQWESEAGDLPCPGKEGDEDGFVILLTSPNLESRHENEPALWTNPQLSNDGYIKGTYPAVKIEDGDHFMADIGCLADNKRCDVIFQLRYRLSDGSEDPLGKKWEETYDGSVTRLNIDLSSLAGEKVQLILIVRANGSSREDAAFWLVPRILH